MAGDRRSADDVAHRRGTHGPSSVRAVVRHRVPGSLLPRPVQGLRHPGRRRPRLVRDRRRFLGVGRQCRPRPAGPHGAVVVARDRGELRRGRGGGRRRRYGLCSSHHGRGGGRGEGPAPRAPPAPRGWDRRDRCGRRRHRLGRGGGAVATRRPHRPRSVASGVHPHLRERLGRLSHRSGPAVPRPPDDRRRPRPDLVGGGLRPARGDRRHAQPGRRARTGRSGWPSSALCAVPGGCFVWGRPWSVPSSPWPVWPRASRWTRPPTWPWPARGWPSAAWGRHGRAGRHVCVPVPRLWGWSSSVSSSPWCRPGTWPARSPAPGSRPPLPTAATSGRRRSTWPATICSSGSERPGSCCSGRRREALHRRLRPQRVPPAAGPGRTRRTRRPARRTGRCLRRAGPTPRGPSAWSAECGIACLVALLVQSSLDFLWHIPVIPVLTAVILATAATSEVRGEVAMDDDTPRRYAASAAPAVSRRRGVATMGRLRTKETLGVLGVVVAIAAGATLPIVLSATAGAHPRRRSGRWRRVRRRGSRGPRHRGRRHRGPIPLRPVFPPCRPAPTRGWPTVRRSR